jgi:hypothetical protein
METKIISGRVIYSSDLHCLLNDATRQLGRL